ncbi:DUF1932 domain-containing protein [Streptomyces sp. NPDC002668]|uniref:DUF1932 domain-containing protein n=1 Tax=Streptomyces sp. NPDC002668 TaxID=3154422 RepID=UPI0033289937
MDQPTVGILHPGSMGAAVAACAKTNAASVLWCPVGRSPASVARAEQHGLEPVPTLQELLDRADMVISLCPPAAAEDLAHLIAEHGFADGVFVEANAVNAERAQRIADLLPRTKAVVDGGVIGSPPVGGKTPTLYLSGPAAATERVEALFSDTAVQTKVLGTEIGQASTLKLAYASFQKASRVLVALSIGIAREHGVDQELIDIASRRTDSYLSEPEYITKTAARAWRWGPELLEAADMLAAAGLPPEMLHAAATTLARWDDVKDDGELTLTDALNRLAQP